MNNQLSHSNNPKKLSNGENAPTRTEVKSLPFLKVPNGYEPSDEIRRDLWKDKDALLSEEQLTEFFTREVVESRLIVCAQLNRDETDDWGLFGYEPGFIFIQKGEILQREPETINEQDWVSGKSLDLFNTTAGFKLPVLGHKDFFPRTAMELMVQEIKESQNPKTFKFLCRLLTGEEIHPYHPKRLRSSEG